MTLDKFRQSLKENEPPAEISELLKALWFDAKGDWERAHNTAQDVHSADGSWVHAYLHRKEGDEGNAGYWYNRAGRKKSALSLEDEWTEIVTHFLRYAREELGGLDRIHEDEKKKGGA